MANKIQKTLLSLITGLLFMISGVFAVQSFSITQTSITENLPEVDSSGSFSIEMSNTGDEDITISISAVNPTDGTNTVSLSLGATSQPIANGSGPETVSVSYTTPSTAGTFTGSINFTNLNTSQTEIIPVTITTTGSGPELSFFNEADDKLTINAEIDKKESFVFYLENTGGETLEDITLEFDEVSSGDDEIDEKDFEFNNDEVDDFEISELDVGENRTFKIKIDTPDVDLDAYTGTLTISAKRPNNSDYEKEFDLEVITFSNEEELEFNNLEPIKVNAEAGETVTGIELEIENKGNNDLSGLRLRLDEDFVEENSDATMSRHIVEFEQNSSIEIFGEEEEVIDFDISIPEGQSQGTYSATIELLNEDDIVRAEITLEIKVTGDVFIQSTSFTSDVLPDEFLDVEITVENQGSQLYRNVKIDAYIYDVDVAKSTLDESTPSFLLDINQEVTKKLRFKIPHDATDGSKTLEIRVKYDNEVVSEIESIMVNRPTYNLEVKSSSINPYTAKCDEQVFTNIKVQNLGKFDQDIRITAEIENENIRTTSNFIEINTDETISENLVLNIEGLEAGEYNVIQKVMGESTTTEMHKLTILECKDATVGIEIEDTSDKTTNETQTQDDNVEVFGKEVEKTTAYLGGAIVGVLALIVISLFLI